MPIAMSGPARPIIAEVSHMLPGAGTYPSASATLTSRNLSDAARTGARSVVEEITPALAGASASASAAPMILGLMKTSWLERKARGAAARDLPHALENRLGPFGHLRPLVDQAALYRVGQGRPSEREVGPQRAHSGNAPTPVTICTANRIVVTTINPPNPVVALSLSTVCPPVVQCVR